MGDAEGTNVYTPEPTTPAYDWGAGSGTYTPAPAPPAYDWAASAPTSTETPDYSSTYTPPAPVTQPPWSPWGSLNGTPGSGFIADDWSPFESDTDSPLPAYPTDWSPWQDNGMPGSGFIADSNSWAYEFGQKALNKPDFGGRWDQPDPNWQPSSNYDQMVNDPDPNVRWALNRMLTDPAPDGNFPHWAGGIWGFGKGDSRPNEERIYRPDIAKQLMTEFLDRGGYSDSFKAQVGDVEPQFLAQPNPAGGYWDREGRNIALNGLSAEGMTHELTHAYDTSIGGRNQPQIQEVLRALAQETDPRYERAANHARVLLAAGITDVEGTASLASGLFGDGYGGINGLPPYARDLFAPMYKPDGGGGTLAGGPRNQYGIPWQGRPGEPPFANSAAGSTTFGMGDAEGTNVYTPPAFSPWQDNGAPGSGFTVDTAGFRPDYTPYTYEKPKDQGFWGGVGNVAGNVAGGLGRAAQFVGDYGLGVKGANNSDVMGLGAFPEGPTVEASPGPFLEGAQTMASGNKFWEEVTGKDPANLPYGLGYATEFASPLGLATLAAGPSVPLIGSAFGGNIAKRAAGEVALNAAGMFGGEKSAELAAEYTDNPWLIGGAGLAGGLGSAVGVFGAAKGVGAGARAADRALTGLDARVMEPAAFSPGQPVDAAMVFDKGMIKGQPARTVIPDSQSRAQSAYDAAGLDHNRAVATNNAEYWGKLQDMQARNAPHDEMVALRDEYDARARQMLGELPSPAPLANERLWFHSTRDMTYDLPDPDLAVGSQTGITQGPGAYMAADPAKSAGNERYGPRTFVVEFDGKTLDLTRPMRVDEPVFAGGPTWAKIRDDLASKLDAKGKNGDFVRDAFGEENLAQALDTARASAANMTGDAANGYVYKQALIGGLEGLYDERTLRGMLGRFGVLPDGMSSTNVAHSVVQNHLADEGVDALFHHSPRADGDVLIVLNGQAARAVADVRNAPEAVKAGATLKDIKRGVATKIVDRAGVARQRADYFDNNPTADYYPGDEHVNRPAGSSIRTFGKTLNDETGALDMGAIGATFGEAGKRAARLFADAAEREGRPTSGGIFDMLAPTERAGTGLVRRYEGAMGTAGLALRTDLDIGNNLLRDAKAPGAWDGSRFVAKRTPDMEQLYKALHGEGQPPASLQKAYDAIKPMVDKESAATIDFDKAFVPRDDYFYRGWKEVPVGKAQNAGAGKGQFGAKPGFMKPRSDQSFSDILNTVYTKPDGTQVRLEPVSWNPFEMAAIRKTAGEQFRAQGDLLAGLKETGMAVSADVAPEGWRVPRVGPAFEGKPFAFTPSAKAMDSAARLADESSGAAVGYTQRIAVPDKVANDIESIFGRQPSFGALDKALAGGQKAKQAKLLLSLFQQMDFGARTLGALNAGVIDELATAVTKAATFHPSQSAGALYRAGRKFIAIPKDLAELPLANVSGAAQRRLRAGILDAKPIYAERPGITLKGVSEAGGKFGTDISLVTRDIMADITKGPKPAYLTTGVVGRRVRQINAASQRGLFDGWYVQAQSVTLKKTILPRIMRQHADWTDAQIMAAGADEVNKMFSTLGEYQTALKNPALKKLMRGLIFSTNETEALLRGAASTVIGPNKRLWTEFYLGTFLGLAAIAETVHYATTGEHLPLDRLSPIDTENDYGPLPFGYRTNFLAPDIPIKGRNGTNLTIDTVMQMDTIFRLLDPKSFVASRENVLPRAISNQVTGKDFYGRPLEGPKDRAAQAAIDLVEPIGAGNLRAAAGVGPDSESRIGTAGAILQTAGANVRAENNATLKDRLAVEWAKSTGATKNDGSPITGWRDLDPLQRPDALESNADIKRELEQRGDDAVRQGSEYGLIAAKRKADAAAIRADNVRIQQEIDAKYIAPGATAPSNYDDGKAWRAEFDKQQYAIARQYDAKETIDPFTGKPYGSEMDKAISAYFTAFDAARSGTETDYGKVDAWRAANPVESALVDKYMANKENRDLTPIVTAKKAASKALGDAGYFDLKDSVWRQIAAQTPSVSQFATYYDYKADIERQVRSQAAGAPPVVVEKIVDSFVSKDPVAKIYLKIANAAETQWVIANPQLAGLAFQWGYYRPTNKERIAIAAGEQ